MKYNAVLGDAADFINGCAFKPADWDGKGKPIIRIQNLTNPDKPINYTTRIVANKYHVSAGDLLVSWSATLGVFEWHGDDALLNQHIFKVVPNLEKTDLKYLRYAIDAAIHQMARYTHGSTMKHINRAEFLKTPVYLPPLEEQRRIAAILDKADTVRKKRQQSLDMLDDFLRATFLDMFGDPATNPKGWDVKVLGESFSTNRAGTQSGPFGSALKKHEYVSTGVPVWGIDCVKPNHFREHAKLFITETKFQDLKRYSVQPGDILISRAGTVGRMCVACPGVAKSIISTNIVRVVLNQECMLPEFFTALFTYCGHRLEGLKSNQKNGAFTFLNPKKLSDLETYRPTLPMQKRYVELTKSVRQKKEAQENFLQAAEDLFASLSQRAFKGEL